MSLLSAPTDVRPVQELRESGVRLVRLLFCDLHGVARGKVFPIEYFERVAAHGVPFARAVMALDLRHNPVGGFESGFQDMLACPDLSTLVPVPWEKHVAWCLADLEEVGSGTPLGSSPRAALKRVLCSYEELGFRPVVAPEVEFYLCEKDDAAPRGFRPYMGYDSHVYTVGVAADQLGLLETMLERCAALGLGACAANHEFGRSQFEINLTYGPALASADRAFLFKTAVKEQAAQAGLLATFMGKPWNDDDGSGFHLHVSLEDQSGANLFSEPDSRDGVSGLLGEFTAGVLAHAPGLAAVLNPTVNAYRRIHAGALAPKRSNWGMDNRFTYIRVPPERGTATRAEVRAADGAANPYLAYAAVLVAGIDGIRRSLQPPQPLVGNIYQLPVEQQGSQLPSSLESSLAALRADHELVDGLGHELVDTFLLLKEAELARYRTWVSDWEFTEYAHHL